MLKCTFQKCFLFFAAVQRPSLAGAVSASLRNPNCSEKVHSFRKYLICEKISPPSENIHSFRKYSNFQENSLFKKKIAIEAQTFGFLPYACIFGTNMECYKNYIYLRQASIRPQVGQRECLLSKFTKTQISDTLRRKAL